MTEQEIREDDKILFREMAEAAEAKLLSSTKSLREALITYPMESWDGYPEMLEKLDEAIAALCSLRGVVIAVRELT